MRTPVARRGVVAARAREVTSFARRFEPAGVPGKKTDARRRWLDAFRSHRRSSFLDSKKKSAERTTRPCHSIFPRDFFLPRPRETQIRDGSRRAIGRERFISAKLELKLELELPKFWAKLELELQFDLQFWVLSSSFGRSTGPIFVEKRDISRKSARFPTTKRAMSETVPETEPTQEVVPRTMVTCGEWSGESAHSRPCVHKPYRVGVKKRPQVVLTWQPARELQFELQFWNCELQFDLQFDLQFCAYKSHHARSLAALGGSVDCAHFENRRFRSPRRNPTAAAES